MTADPPAPFIPPLPGEPPAAPTGPWRVFGTKSYFRLWLAQVNSSIGDWIGLIAIVAIAARISNNSGAAVSLVMVARVVPGFFLGTVGGVLIDRLDRRKVMVVCDIGRATLLAILPFAESLFGLVLISFGLEILTLLWGPAKDASVPHLVPKEQLTSANTLSLVASFGTFPIASVLFSLLAALAAWLGGIDALSDLRVDQEVLALFADAGTFLVSAFLVFRLPIPHDREPRARRIDWLQAVHEIREGATFIAGHPRVRGIMLGMGFGLIGAGAMVPLGPVFARQALDGDSATFGVLYVALGFGASAGVITLLALQRRVNKEKVFEYAVMGTGLFLFIGVSISSVVPVALFIALTGACAGTSYVSGFTTLQEQVHDELRGRTFAALYTVIRLCLLLTLVLSPLFADFWDWFVELLMDGHTLTVGDGSYSFAGSRLALWGGAVLTLGAGWFAKRSVDRAHREDEAAAGAATSAAVEGEIS